MKENNLTTSLSTVHGIGPVFAERLERLGLKTVKDLLYHFPFRYQDFSNIKSIAELSPNEVATVHGVIEKISISKTFYKKLLVITARVADESGFIEVVWFNQRHLLTQLKEGISINIAGVVKLQGKKLQFQSPEFEIISRDSYVPRHTGKLIPIYSETKGITSKGIRFVMEKVLPLASLLPEFLPPEILAKNSFPTLSDALEHIHRPASLTEAEEAQKRFAFQDLFLLQLIKTKEKYHLAQKPAHAFPYTAEQIKKYFSYLPFVCTPGQKKALYDILEDLSKSYATHRLLQGDVGSGKTIVAAIAALVVASHQKQAVFMAPTEVLAQQHYHTFTSFFEEFSHGVALLTSNRATVFFGKELERDISKKELLAYIASGKIKIVIGTHSVIQKNVAFDDVGLLVIDEQHRFGVHQRAALLSRTQTHHPHLLSMSATPIPRTLSLTLLGDLELSIINELPKNRKPIDTRIVPALHRQQAYAFIRQQAKLWRQVYVVCPRIASLDPEQKLTPRQLLQLDVKNVEEEYKKLSKTVFKDLRVGMLHGQMKSNEKQKTMNSFKNGIIDVLVSTSVIEVGVDVPNATIMMIEGSEYFGLSQLYQFRGRVGRGEHQSYCFLFTESRSKITMERLKALIKAKNGFELAEMDLKFRGPGQFLGTEQTGIPDLAMKAMQNPRMVKEVYESVQSLLKQDPELKKYPYLAEYLKLFEKQVHLE